MGRSTSCFRIIACGSNSNEKDELDLNESKGSSDRRGWSFRKRSARHRVLSNTVISEIPTSGNKESPENVTINFQTPVDSTVPEKTSILQWPDEKPQLSTSFNSKVSETVVTPENENKIDPNPDDSVVIVIQTAIRGFLAQRTVLRLKNVIKLQAAVRGHLVRRHAAGTLRVIQAIVKIQVIIRARRVHAENLDGRHGKDKPNLKPMKKQNSAAKPIITYTSIEKLLSNGFARQLLESTPRTKSIHIKCDPSSPNPGWQWLERWMSVSSSNLGQPPIPELEKEQLEHERIENSAAQVETGITSEATSESEDLKPSNREAAVPSESEENLITYDVDSFDFQTCHPTSCSVKDNLEVPPSDNTGTSSAKDNPLDIDLPPSNIMQTEENSQTEFNSASDKPEMESEQPKLSTKRFASEQLESEGKKFVFGSRKASNPAFIAAQSKFEELSSTANSGRLISSSSQDVGVESNIDTISPAADASITTNDLKPEENLIPHNSRVQVGGSECGTELSITSTLDSPDISEVGAMDFDNEAKVSEEGMCNLNSAKGIDVESKDASISVSNLSDTVLAPPEKLDAANDESVDSVVDVDSSQVKQKPERSASDLQIELDPQTAHQAFRLSPEASPRSHITVPESQGTPSSQVSVKAKRSRTDKSGSNKKRTSLSAGKKSPSNPSNDSDARSSMEQLPKDQKTGKRRNSFGSTRPDHVDQEARDSSSSNSLPNYMQATESARAKAHANNSPRSSPDVQDKDIYMKKRHSLSGSNGRQGSPRIQRSMSQAQQGAKGNDGHPPHEKKWQR